MFFISINLQVFAQHPSVDPSPYRGIYVNKFINRSNPTNGILGTQKENEFLRFAKDNNFKRIDLTHLDEIFPNHLSDPTPSGNSYEDDLCSFMTKAREYNCVEQIAAVAAGYNYFSDFNDWNVDHITGPYDFSTSNIPGITTFNSTFSFVQNTYSPSDGSIVLISEMVKFYLRILDYNYRDQSSGISGTLHPCRFEVFTIEYEYWNTPWDWNGFKLLMISLQTLQINTGHSFDIHLYTLIRQFVDNTGDTITQQEIANFIDPIVDKIYLTDYPNTEQFGTSNVPADFWNLNYFRWGMDALRISPPINTIITPLFNNMDNSEGIHLWLLDPAHPENTLYTAEQLFWANKQLAANTALIGNSILTEGSYQWFKYTEFPHTTSHWPNPYCTNNEIFYVLNNSVACPASNTINTCTGNNLLFKYISNYEDNVTCDWAFGDGSILSSVSPGDQSHSYQQPGSYIVSCHLTFPLSTYPNSQAACEYNDFQRTVVVSGAGITANGPTTICQGNSVQLTAS